MTDQYRYYISPHRDILANNHPGQPWYRIPCIGVAGQLCDGELEPIEEEGTFYEDKEEEWSIGQVIKVSWFDPLIVH
jgi:hypothetical protein